MRKAQATGKEETVINSTIYSFLNKIKLHDISTYQHCQRVAQIAGFIGKCVGLEESDRNSLKYSALLHDIGKINIPRELINKNGKLTDEEKYLMQLHPLDGAKILKRQRLPTKEIVAGIAFHHEYYGGGGYPFGMSGENIHFLARIISIADAFDAMVSPRPYKIGTMDLREALMEVHDKAGQQFDPYIAGKLSDQNIGNLYDGLYGYTKQCIG